MNWNNSITRFLRNWHRDLGYFTVAVTLLYALSGMLLTHKDIFPVISTYKTVSEFPTDLDIAGFSEYWKQQDSEFILTKCDIRNDEILFYFKGGKGEYMINTGEVTVENYKKHILTAFVNQLHLNQVKYWKHIADFFCVSLIFLAVSGLFIVKGKKGFKKRGVWFMTAGFVVVLIFLFL